MPAIKVRSGPLPVLVLNQIRGRTEIDKDILRLQPGQWIEYPGAEELTTAERKRLVTNLRSKWYRGRTRRRVLYTKDFKNVIVAHPESAPET